MTSLDDTLSSDEYDEFGLLHENATEWDIELDALPHVFRHRFELTIEIVEVQGAGHAVQSDRPLELTALIRAFDL